MTGDVGKIFISKFSWEHSLWQVCIYEALILPQNEWTYLKVCLFLKIQANCGLVLFVWWCLVTVVFTQWRSKINFSFEFAFCLTFCIASFQFHIDMLCFMHAKISKGKLVHHPSVCCFLQKNQKCEDLLVFVLWGCDGYCQRITIQNRFFLPTCFVKSLARVEFWILDFWLLQMLKRFLEKSLSHQNILLFWELIRFLLYFVKRCSAQEPTLSWLEALIQVDIIIML